jgi:hypothetical protein
LYSEVEREFTHRKFGKTVVLEQQECRIENVVARVAAGAR